MLPEVQEKQSSSVFYQLLYVCNLVEAVCYSTNDVLCFYRNVLTHIAS